MRIWALFLAVACGACATAAPRATDAPVVMDAAGVREMAVAALQGSTDEPFLSERDIARAVEAIMALRRQVPEMRDAGPGPRGPLEIRMTDSAWARLTALNPGMSDGTRLAQTGLPGLDSLNAALGASGVRVNAGFLHILHVEFTGPANVPALTPAYGALPEVRFANEPLYLGVEQGMTVRLHGDTAALRVWKGWGDCLSGCIHSRNWEFAYHPRTGRVVLVSDSGVRTVGET